MELDEFHLQTRTEVREAIADRPSVPGSAYPYEETIFTEVVMEHMSEFGMTFEPEVCHYAATVGNARLRLSGYAVSEDADQLDLFVSLYEGVETITPIPDSETKMAAEQCLRFLSRCAQGRLAGTMDQSNDAYAVAHTIVLKRGILANPQAEAADEFICHHLPVVPLAPPADPRRLRGRP